jgi:hypothetical protein
MLGFQAKIRVLHTQPSEIADAVHRSKKSGHRSMAIEYTLIALLTASAAFEALFLIGAKAV